MHLSAKNSTYDVAKILIANGSIVFQKNGVGDTPLHISAYKGDSKMLDMFIYYGADVNIENDKGQTAIEIMCLHGHNNYNISNFTDVNKNMQEKTQGQGIAR